MSLRDEIRERLKRRCPALLSSKAPLPALPEYDPTGIVLGADCQDMPVVLPLLTQREHTLISGASGSGKSRCLTFVGKQAIDLGHTLIHADPNGNDPGGTHQQLVEHSYKSGRKTYVIDFNSGKLLGWNPLHLHDGVRPHVVVDRTMKARAAVWPEEKKAQPTTERVLSLGIHVLTVLGLSLCELEPLLDPADYWGLRRYALSRIKDPFIRYRLQQLDILSKDKMARREYRAEIIGPVNRIFRLLEAPALRGTFGQTKNCIDLQKVMDENANLFINGSGGNELGSASDMFMALMISDILASAERRTTTTPCTFMFDESYRYLNHDIEATLAQLRKFNCAVWLSITWLGQVKDHDERVYHALLAGTKTKLSFHQNEYEAAETLALQSMRLNLEHSIKVLEKPTVVDHEIIELEQTSTTDSASRAVQDITTIMNGIAEMNGISKARAASVVDMASHSDGRSHVAGRGVSANLNTSEVEIMNLTANPDAPMLSRMTVGNTVGQGTQTNEADGVNSADTTSKGIVFTTIEAEMAATTRQYSEAKTSGNVDTTGKADTNGKSQALKPVMQVLPTTVHSKENALYMAATYLMSLPVAHCYVGSRTKDGIIHTEVQIPPDFSEPMSMEAFKEMRDTIMGDYPTIEEALKAIERRAREATMPKDTRGDDW